LDSLVNQNEIHIDTPTLLQRTWLISRTTVLSAARQWLKPNGYLVGIYSTCTWTIRDYFLCLFFIFFYSSCRACLRAWLLQHASCPTCRWSPNHGHHGFTAAQLATLLSAAFPETHADDLRHQQHGDGHQPRLHPEQQVEIDGIQEPLATLEEVFVPPIVPEQPREQQTPKRRDVRQPVLTSPRLTRSGISRRLNTLQLRLPHVSTNILEAALLDCDGDVDLVFERLSNHT